MAHCVIGYGNAIDVAALSTGSHISTALVTALQDPRISRRWQSATGVNSTFLLADFGATVTIGVMMLAGTNLGASATRQVRVSSADATGAAGDIHNSGSALAGVDPNYGLLVYLFPAPVNGRYLRLDIADSAKTVLSAGRWAALTSFQPKRNFTWGYEDIYDDRTLIDLADDGTEWVERGMTQSRICLHLASPVDGRARLNHSRTAPLGRTACGCAVRHGPSQLEYWS